MIHEKLHCRLLRVLIFDGLFSFIQVREVYWRVYNNVYIGHQDAMVAFFPKLPDYEKHSFTHYELELVI